MASQPEHGPEEPHSGRSKPQPLYMRMYFQAHLTALVRAVGYAGFPAEEGPQRMRPLIEKYGESLMRAAADEIVEIDHSQKPPMARLTAHARQLAAGILGRPPEAPPLPSHVPPPPPPATAQDQPPAASARPKRKRSAKPQSPDPGA